MSLTATGIGSGLDITSIVKVLVDAEKVPKEAIFDNTEANIKSKVSAIGTLKSKISAFQDAMEKLKDGSSVNQRTVSTGESMYVSAEATSSAKAGSYEIQVEQLAKSHKVGGAFKSDAAQTVGAGSIDLTIGSESFSVDIEATDDLNAIAAKVNDATDNIGVTATVITSDGGSRIVFTSDTEGTDSQISVNATDTSGTGLSDMFNGANLTEVQAAQNSIVHIDGQKLTSQTNEVSNAISGVTLELTKADLNETTTLKIGLDEEGVKENIQGFVDAYNSLVESITDLSTYDTEKEEAAALQGDSLLRSLSSQLRSIVSDRVDDGNGNTTALYDIGVELDRYGKLNIDSSKLDETIKNDMDSLENLFAKDTVGLAVQFDELAENYVKSGGLIDSRNNSYTEETKRLADQREAFELKMTQLEARLTKQFNAMDLVVASLNAESAGLSAKLASLPGVVSQ
ncbi:flagellar filament capping protein FliD [Shewanella sp. WXL01]|uniref:flagellar filament capping protein FliD n=1 Tax=Shewanella sp. WXL01 TaxID=2709721 RepID=UPI0014385BE8|nr:flagellar filament capping protein FliD [Shewanella sp. WXL01]NKF50213.1 flagellar filament capping protein FliD [Shewanella sp. WXL01]